MVISKPLSWASLVLSSRRIAEVSILQDECDVLLADRQHFARRWEAREIMLVVDEAMRDEGMERKKHACTAAYDRSS